VLVLCFFFFCILIYFLQFLCNLLNNDYTYSWVVDVNSFLTFGLRMKSFGIGFFAPTEEYELSIYIYLSLSGIYILLQLKILVMI
jgi:hypothetical protein